MYAEAVCVLYLYTYSRLNLIKTWPMNYGISLLHWTSPEFIWAHLLKRWDIHVKENNGPPLGCISIIEGRIDGRLSLFTDKGHAENQSYLIILALDLTTSKYNGFLTIGFSEIQSNCEQTLDEHKIGHSAGSWDIDQRWDQVGPVELGCTFSPNSPLC